MKFWICCFYVCFFLCSGSSKQSFQTDDAEEGFWRSEFTKAQKTSGFAVVSKQPLTCNEVGGECSYGCSIYFEGYELCNNGMYCCADKVVDIPGSVDGSLDPICHSKQGRCIKKKTGCDGGRFWSNMCDNAPQRYCCMLQKKPDKMTTIADGTCGKRLPKFALNQNVRVIGGRVADKGSWPFVFSLRMLTGLGGGVDSSHLCGGSVLSPEWGVTAAHCVAKRSPKEMLVRVGDYDLEAFESEEVELKVDTILVHPDYAVTLDGDIALIKFASPIKFTDYRQPLCLPPQMDPVRSDIAAIPLTAKGATTNNATNDGGETPMMKANCWVVGWGATKKEDLSNDLKEGKGQVWPRKACEEQWGGAATKNTLCFGDGDSHGPCRGDSGGPLLCLEGDSFTLEGIVSWGTPSCMSHGVPAVFTRVRSYVDWISGFTNVKPPKK